MKQAENIAANVLYQGKFIGLEEITYVNEDAKVRRWESAVRTHRTPAVMLIAEILPENEIVLIRQFRPATGHYVWETPAGLIELGEKPEAAGLRELYEETGFQGKLTKILPASFSSCGLSDECVYIAWVKIDGHAYPDGMLPEAHPDCGEHIQVVRVPKRALHAFLAQKIQAGDGVDSKLLLYSEIAG